MKIGHNLMKIGQNLMKLGHFNENRSQLNENRSKLNEIRSQVDERPHHEILVFFGIGIAWLHHGYLLVVASRRLIWVSDLEKMFFFFILSYFLCLLIFFFCLFLLIFVFYFYIVFYLFLHLGLLTRRFILRHITPDHTLIHQPYESMNPQ